MPKFSNLADAAVYLAQQKDIMDSFYRFEKEGASWFWSHNAGLSGSNPKPAKFIGWDDWHKFRMGQKLFLCQQAGINSNAVGENKATLATLQTAWKKWSADLCAVFWGGGSAHAFTCNVFVGECLYLCGHGNQAVHAGKYLSAKSYWMGHNNGLVREVKKLPANIRRGMIMSLHVSGDTYHLEVITSGSVEQEEGWIFKDTVHTFRSRGGGRGQLHLEGAERTGTAARDLKNDSLKIFQLN
jgi:hypothetical protein